MNTPLNRQELQERIAELDKQINLEVGRSRVPRLNLKHRSFPITSWISAFFFLGFWVFGGMFLKSVHDKFAFWALLIGGLIAVLALWNTVMWLFTGNQKADKTYAAAMDKMKELQDERAALAKQLKQMGKA